MVQVLNSRTSGTANTGGGGGGGGGIYGGNGGCRWKRSCYIKYA
jgi:hypothetical protein